jgi:hypothetical protein
MVQFCFDLISKKKNDDKKLECRHNCFYFGTLEEDKGPGIRKSTVAKEAKCQYSAPDNSTKIRCYHIAFFSKFVGDLTGLKIALEKIDAGQVIRHLCGCRNCTDPDHLVLGTSADNMNDRGIHLLLEAAWKTNPQMDYLILRALLKHNKFDQI